PHDRAAVVPRGGGHDGRVRARRMREKPRRTPRPGSTGTRACDLFNNIAEGCRCPDPPPGRTGGPGPAAGESLETLRDEVRLATLGKVDGVEAPITGQAKESPDEADGGRPGGGAHRRHGHPGGAPAVGDGAAG